MIEREIENPSGYKMPKPSRFVFLDDLSNGDRYLESKAEELTELIDSLHHANRVESALLTRRLQTKYLAGATRGIYPYLDLLIGVGSTGYKIGQELEFSIPIIKVTPHRVKNADGKNSIVTRSGKSLDEEINKGVPLIANCNQPTIGIVDDTVFSGNTLLEISSAVNRCFEDPKTLTLTLTSVPAFFTKGLRDSGMPVISAFKIRTNEENNKGLNTVDLRDLVEKDALSLHNGGNIAFMDEEYWMRTWFGDNYEKAMELCQQIKNYLQQQKNNF